jgi:hypothetical protein
LCGETQLRLSGLGSGRIHETVTTAALVWLLTSSIMEVTQE